MILSVSLISIIRGMGGLIILLVIGWICSRERKKINWRLVTVGVFMQIVLAVAVLKVPVIALGFEWISRAFIKVISFTDYGIDFLLRRLGAEHMDGMWLNFTFKVLPTIIFFSALSSMLYYLGILQKIVYGFAWMMKRSMRLSGAESLAAAGNIFLGQTEAPFLIKPYLGRMTRSEMMCLMTGGMATIAGGVLAAYIGFLGGDDPQQKILFAKHLLTASVMSAPAAIVAAKMLVPETEQFDARMEVSKEKIGSNILEAIANGTTDGLRLAVNVAAMLLVFTALIYFGNYLMEDVIGRYSGLNEMIRAHTPYTGLSFQFLLGYCFAPVSWLIGVNGQDVLLVGQLLGEKTILNEFYAYVTLGDMKMAGAFAEKRSIIMATYMLCGFSNFASIGIQIGGIGALIPHRKGLLAQLGLPALIGGTLACLFTAAIVGMLM